MYHTNCIRVRAPVPTRCGSVRARAVAPPDKMGANKEVLTSNGGAPVSNNTDSLTVGARGPVLLEDFRLIEKISQFDREKIPERIVHARGAAAFGEFEVTGDISKYTDAKMFQKVGSKTPVQARFSTVIHPRGSPESLRDVRGFTVRFQTDEGNWDLVGNNMPVFFVRDGHKFVDMVHALKPDPMTHEQRWWRIFDFFSFHPESAHVLTWLLDDVGIPASYRHMDGFGVHTFAMVKDGKMTYVKFHWHTDQGVKNLSDEDAITTGGTNASFASTDLFTTIESGEYPSWTFKMQFMDPADEDKLEYDPLDATKVWPEEDYPLVEVGRMKLNRNPKNFFAENEQMAFSPNNIVPGITFTNDKLLQTRLFSYADAQRYRIGVNYQDLPVNRPQCPFHENNYEGKMQMRVPEEKVDYWPSNFRPNEVEAEKTLHGNTGEISGTRVQEGIPKTNDFYFPGKRFREFDEERQKRLAMRIGEKMSMPGVNKMLQDKWIDIWTKCDETLAKMVKENMTAAEE